MTIPRLIVLTIYPLLAIASTYAALQARKLARFAPSQAWTTKRRNQLFFVAVQVFGLTQNVIFSRQASWMGAIYFSGILCYCLGLNRFDYLLLRDSKRIRLRAAAMVDLPTTAGDMTTDYWQQSHYDQSVKAIKDWIKPEYLK